MRRTALLIGSQTYGLTGVGNDIATMSAVLARRGFSIVVCEGPNATRAGLLDHFRRLIHDSRQTDAVVVYYSGHGGQALAPPALTREARQSSPRLQFIVPTDYEEPAWSDFRGVTAPELSVLLARLTAVTRNVSVVLDTCHAAHMSRGDERQIKALRRPAYVDVAEHLDRLRRQGFDTSARHVLGNQEAVRLVACGRDESAYEYTNDAGRRIGMLTESIALALTEVGDQPVTWAALTERVRSRVMALARDQRPEAEGPSLRLLFQPVFGNLAAPLAAVAAAGEKLEASVSVEWGQAVDGRQRRLPLTGAVVHEGDHVYVKVRNDSGATVYVSVLFNDIASAPQVVTSLDPSGVALRPGQAHVIGSDEIDGRLTGFALAWPTGAEHQAPLARTMMVLVSSAPQDVSLLLAGGDQRMAEPRYRDLVLPDADPARRDVHSIAFRLHRRPPAAGDARPRTVHRPEVTMGDTIYGNKYGGDHVEGDKIVNMRGDDRARRGPRKVILLMSASQDLGQPLRLDEERREIDFAVTTAQAGDRLEIHTADALRLDDLQSSLLRYTPAIAHFSGHGSATDGIVVSDGLGGTRPVPPKALSGLFGILKSGLRCVVLNACFTEEQARAIAEHVPCVVGMRGRVLDDAAIRFAAGFYHGIAHARSIRESFQLGCNRLDLHGYPDSDTPRLIAAPGHADRPLIDRPG